MLYGRRPQPTQTTEVNRSRFYAVLFDRELNFPCIAKQRKIVDEWETVSFLSFAGIAVTFSFHRHTHTYTQTLCTTEYRQPMNTPLNVIPIARLFGTGKISPQHAFGIGRAYRMLACFGSQVR